MLESEAELMPKGKRNVTLLYLAYGNGHTGATQALEPAGTSLFAVLVLGRGYLKQCCQRGPEVDFAASSSESSQERMKMRLFMVVSRIDCCAGCNQGIN